MRPIRPAIVAACVPAALLVSACSAIQSNGETFNQAPTYEGPGCYDFKGRIEPTIPIKAECDAQGWVWKTAP